MTQNTGDKNKEIKIITSISDLQVSTQNQNHRSMYKLTSIYTGYCAWYLAVDSTGIDCGFYTWALTVSSI